MRQTKVGAENRRRLRAVIEQLIENKEEVTYGSVTQAYRDKYSGRNISGVSNRIVYEILGECGIAKRERSVTSRVDPVMSAVLVGVSTDQKPSCFFCEFWRVSPEDLRSGEALVRMECRRLPPFPAADGAAVWPRVRPLDRCGEFSDNALNMRALHPSHIGLLIAAADCEDSELGQLAAAIEATRFSGRISAMAAWLRSFSPHTLKRLQAGHRRLATQAPWKLLGARFVRYIDLLVRYLG